MLYKTMDEAHQRLASLESSSSHLDALTDPGRALELTSEIRVWDALNKYVKETKILELHFEWNYGVFEKIMHGNMSNQYFFFFFCT